MSLRINTNVQAFAAHRSLSANSIAMGKSMEKLSSGFRINRAADDAAGLGISERMRAQIRGLEQAQRNVQDGISFVQASEGAMTEMHSILHRARELAVQFGNGVGGANAQAAITAEMAQLGEELNRMITSATFNGSSMFGASSTINLQVGANAGDTMTVSLGDPATALGGVMAALTGGSGVGIGAIDTAINALATQRADLGAVQNRLEYATNALAIQQENMMAAESRIRDVDMASEMTKMTKAQILVQSGTAMLGQANSAPQNILGLLR